MTSWDLHALVASSENQVVVGGKFLCFPKSVATISAAWLIIEEQKVRKTPDMNWAILRSNLGSDTDFALLRDPLAVKI